MEKLLRLAPSVALKERRLRDAFGEAFDQAPVLREAVQAAQAAGSLELAGLAVTPESSRALRDAQAAVDPAAPFSVKALAAWHAAATGGPSAWRREERPRTDGPPFAPPAFIESRMATLEHWLSVDSARELGPFQAGALALARIQEVLPFDAANGRVSRLAASHLAVRAGARPLVLVGADAPRLAAAVDAAFQLHTEPLARLLEEASERALDAMLTAAKG